MAGAHWTARAYGVSMSAVHLLRHAQPNYELAMARSLDFRSRDMAPLTPDGVDHAHATAEYLRPFRLTAIASSPMTRTLQTAAHIASDLRLPLWVDIDLREWNAGVPDDGTIDDWKRATAQFRAHTGHPPNGARWESVKHLRVRVTAQ